MVKVLDACALMVYLEKEPGYEKIKELLVKSARSDINLLMSVVNWGEVFYVLIRNCGFDEAHRIQRAIETLPIEFVPADLSIARQAALYKATKKLSYADCFAAALAKLCKGEVITSDKEFEALENEIKIAWIS